METHAVMISSALFFSNPLFLFPLSYRKQLKRFSRLPAMFVYIISQPSGGPGEEMEN